MLAGKYLNKCFIELPVRFNVLVIVDSELLGDTRRQVAKLVDHVIHWITRDYLVALIRRHKVGMVECAPLPRDQVIKLCCAFASDSTLGYPRELVERPIDD